MFQIQWKLYSESEILEILTELFRAKGYDVYNAHKTDRSNEHGIDMECTKTAQSQKITIAVKKKPIKMILDSFKSLPRDLPQARFTST